MHGKAHHKAYPFCSRPPGQRVFIRSIVWCRGLPPGIPLYLSTYPVLVRLRAARMSCRQEEWAISTSSSSIISISKELTLSRPTLAHPQHYLLLQNNKSFSRAWLLAVQLCNPIWQVEV